MYRPSTLKKKKVHFFRQDHLRQTYLRILKFSILPCRQVKDKFYINFIMLYNGTALSDVIIRQCDCTKHSYILFSFVICFDLIIIYKEDCYKHKREKNDCKKIALRIYWEYIYY